MFYSTRDDYEPYLEDIKPQENATEVSTRAVTEHEVSRTPWYHKGICYYWLTPS